MMKRVLTFICIIIYCTNLYSQERNWTTTKLKEFATLRVLSDSGEYLKILGDIPAGTKVRYDINGYAGKMNYKDQSGEILMSRKGWVQGINLEWIPEVAGRERMYGWNQLKVYISVSSLPDHPEFKSDTPTQVPTPTQKPAPTQKPTPPTPQNAGDCYQIFLDSGVKKNVLDHVLEYFEYNKYDFANRDQVAISDFSQGMSVSRFYLLNLKTCEVFKAHVAHGENGGTGSSSTVTKCTLESRFPDRPTTNTSRPGFVKISDYHRIRGEDQTGKKSTWTYITSGYPRQSSLSVHSLEQRNWDVTDFGVVFHESSGFDSDWQYRSQGCSVLKVGKLKEVQGQLAKGTLYYSYIPACGL